MLKLTKSKKTNFKYSAAFFILLRTEDQGDGTLPFILLGQCCSLSPSRLHLPCNSHLKQPSERGVLGKGASVQDHMQENVEGRKATTAGRKEENPVRTQEELKWKLSTSTSRNVRRLGRAPD